MPGLGLVFQGRSEFGRRRVRVNGLAGLVDILAQGDRSRLGTVDMRLCEHVFGGISGLYKMSDLFLPRLLYTQT